MTNCVSSVLLTKSRGPNVTWESGRHVIRRRCGTAASKVDPGGIGGRDLYGATQISPSYNASCRSKECARLMLMTGRVSL
jgi:hypothetical protein